MRASAIIIKDKKILLVHRKRNGKEYWVLPGGRIEEGENGEEAILREVREETGLFGKNPRLAFRDFDVNSENHYYLVDVDSFEVKLGGPEAKRNSKENWYQPEWINLGEIRNLNLLLEKAKVKLQKNLK